MELIGKNNTEVIGQLCERYGISKSSMYNRLKLLKIGVVRKDGQACLEEADLEVLDRLAEWIGQGNPMESFCGVTTLARRERQEIATQEAEMLFLEEVEEGNQIQQLTRSAQEKAAGVLIAQNILAKQFQNNPQLLDDDLKKQVLATEEALAPKTIDPKQYALSLVKKCLR